MTVFSAIRDATSPEMWSRGVEIARGGRVALDVEGEDEVILRVQMNQETPPFTVHLWMEDLDWACDCPSTRNVCPHIAAASIAWTQAKKTGRGLSGTASKMGHVGYRFMTHERGLKLSRVCVKGAKQTRLAGALGTSETAKGVVFTDNDLQIEKVMSHRFDRLIPRELLPRVLHAMSGCGDVCVDGDTIKASSQPVVPVGRVDSVDEGFRVRIVRDPGIAEVYAGSGAVRCDGQLRPIGRGGLLPEQYKVLTRGVYYDSSDVGRLVTEILPNLEKRIPFGFKSPRLPSSIALPPRVVLKTSRDGETLIVKPLIVYGSPPSAHVERGELVLRDGQVPIRDKRAEERLSRKVAETLGIAAGLESRFTGVKAVHFVECLDGFSGKLEGGGWKKFQRDGVLRPSVSVTEDRVDVDWGGAQPERIMQAWAANESLVPLVDGGWAELPADWLEKYGDRVFDLLASRERNGRVPRYALFDLAKLCEDLNQPPPPGLDSLKALVSGFAGIPESPLPTDLTATLRSYQRQGVNWLCFLKQADMGGILADDMGLGKTIQALCAIQGQTLVVAPTSVIHNWETEIARFRPNLKVCRYHGPRRQLNLKADVTLTSYALLRLDSSKLSAISWDTTILDEAQAIKNPTSQVAQAAFGLDAKFRVTLTGTPVENRLDELWSQFHFINPGLLGGRRDFHERYAKPIAVGEPGAARRLRDRIKPFILRRLKSEVAPELPPRTNVTLRCTLTPDERRSYDTIRIATQEKLVRQIGGKHSVMAALEALLRLRQAACHSGLLPGQVATNSSKVTLLVETLEEVISGGHKSLVFSQWTSMLNFIEPHLREREIDYVRLDGSTRDRKKAVETFQSESGPSVFLISLKAGGTGLNLVAADHVFLVDPWWNPAVEDQAADRAHRIGQDKPVMVYRLVAEDTVEERILGLQERKRMLADAALGEANQASGLTRDELLALLA